MPSSFFAAATVPIRRRHTRWLAALAVSIPLGSSLLRAILDHRYRQWLCSLNGQFGSLMFSGPFLILGVAFLRPSVSRAACGTMSVGLTMVVVLFGMMGSSGDGGGVSQGSLNAGLYTLLLNCLQYESAVGTVLAGIGFDAVAQWMRNKSHRGPECRVERNFVSDDPGMPESTDHSTAAPCSAGEAMEMAIRTAVIAHLAVCILTLAFFSASDQGWGILVGLGVAGVLACGIPFLVLPVAIAIGYFVHLGFHGTRVSVPILVRTLVILFEATLFGWIVVLTIVWQPF